MIDVDRKKLILFRVIKRKFWKGRIIWFCFLQLVNLFLWQWLTIPWLKWPKSPNFSCFYSWTRLCMKKSSHFQLIWSLHLAKVRYLPSNLQVTFVFEKSLIVRFMNLNSHRIWQKDFEFMSFWILRKGKLQGFWIRGEASVLATDMVELSSFSLNPLFLVKDYRICVI